MFKRSKSEYKCPVCFYDLDYAPSDFNICPSCGTEFGYSDSGRSFEELRAEWLRLGAKWSSSVVEKAQNWNPIQQLLNAGIGFELSHDVEDSFVPVAVPVGVGHFHWSANAADEKIEAVAV